MGNRQEAGVKDELELGIIKPIAGCRAGQNHPDGLWMDAAELNVFSLPN